MQKGKEMAAKYSMMFEQVSAKTGYNVKEAINKLKLCLSIS